MVSVSIYVQICSKWGLRVINQNNNLQKNIKLNKEQARAHTQQTDDSFKRPECGVAKLVLIEWVIWGGGGRCSWCVYIYGCICEI